jgi:D-arabinose 1-dehydrogenase-like Zn-dependent alcohol dehydrogenase
LRSYQIVEFGAALEARDYPTPTPQGTEVLMAVRACGVCHSDLHLWHGYFDLGGGRRLTLDQRGVELPFTLGHEIVGEVAALGPDAARVAAGVEGGGGVEVGDKRIVYPWIGCGDCDACRRDDELLCNRLRTIGTRRDGGYSDYVMVPHPRYLVDYAGVPEDRAGTYACSGLTAYSALKRFAALGENDSLVIIGAGGVGLNAVLLSPQVVRAKVVVADIDAAKRDAAREAGAAHVVDNGAPDARAAVRELTGGGARAVIDFVGGPASVEFGLKVLGRGGTLLVVGLNGGQIDMSLALYPLKLLTVQGAYVGTLTEMHELMRLAKAGAAQPIPIATRPLAEATAALEDLEAGKVVGRVVLKP